MSSFVHLYPADEVNFIFKGAYSTTFAWRVAEAVGKLVARPGKAFLKSKLPAELSGSLIIFGGIFCFFVIGGNTTGHATSWSLAQGLVFPVALLALLLSLGIPIAVMWAIALFGTSNIQDSLAVSLRTSMRPNGVKNVRFFSVSPVAAARAYLRRRNVHTNIMYSETVSREIANFVSELASAQD